MLPWNRYNDIVEPFIIIGLSVSSSRFIRPLLGSQNNMFLLLADAKAPLRDDKSQIVRLCWCPADLSISK